MAVIRGFRDLDVYRVAREQSRAVFQVSRTFPREETYSLTDQIRRASRAVGAMIAEAWARRRYQAAFVNKLNEALGEAMETQAWFTPWTAATSRSPNTGTSIHGANTLARCCKR